MAPWGLANSVWYYGYSNAQSTAYAVSAEKGISIGLGLDEAAPALGSESTLTAIGGVVTGYQLLPWGQHHVLALGLSGGTSLGTAGGTSRRRELRATLPQSVWPAFDKSQLI